MTDQELIIELRNSKGWPNLGNAAADRIEQLAKERDAIRKAALCEAVAVAEELAIKWWHEYKDRLSHHCADPRYEAMSDGAGDVAVAIHALIGEKK